MLLYSTSKYFEISVTVINIQKYWNYDLTVFVIFDV